MRKIRQWRDRSPLLLKNSPRTLKNIYHYKDQLVNNRIFFFFFFLEIVELWTFTDDSVVQI